MNFDEEEEEELFEDDSEQEGTMFLDESYDENYEPTEEGTLFQINIVN
jgi:hypothetical protein